MRASGGSTRSRPQRQRRALQRADDPVSFAPKCPVVKAVEARQRDAAELAAHEESGQDTVPTQSDPQAPPPDNTSDPTVE